MCIETKPVMPELIDDLSSLFCSDATADKCWCMWFIRSVKEFHQVGHDGNKTSLIEIVKREKLPVGILAYHEGDPKGWCAVGPRERFVRGIKTPTYRTQDPDPFKKVWLVPCFFVREDARGLGLSQALLGAAVELAINYGAEAIDGFPIVSDKKRSHGEIQVGFEKVFLQYGFKVMRRPSKNRVVVRYVVKK